MWTSHRFELMLIDNKTDDRWVIERKYDTKREVMADAKIFMAAGFAVSVSKLTTKHNSWSKVVFSTLNDHLRS